MDVEGVDPDRLPVHVAIVMDGNGRWAQQRHLPRTDGHAAGEAALFDTVHGAVDIGLRQLTVYAFSTENWNRPVDEVRFLMGFNRSILARRTDELDDMNVRILTAGRRNRRVPRSVLSQMDRSVEQTASNSGLVLTIAFNYGGRAELIDAVERVVRDGLAPDEVDEKAIASRLYVPEMADVDLMIRTSGELRLSNFLLWQVAYAELVFTDTLWPDFRREHLFEAVRRYQSRERRFGSVGG